MSETKTTNWVGWGRFAGVIIFLSGAFSATQGLVALFAPDTYYAIVEGQLFIFDVQGWAWWNIILGVLLILVAGGLAAGQTWARVIAIILVSISAISQLFLIPVQPFWAVVIIAVDVLVIFALTVHGKELKDA
jgi:hypothetical protein